MRSDLRAMLFSKYMSALYPNATVLLTKRGKNENVPFFSHNSVTKHDVENNYIFGISMYFCIIL